MSSSHKGDRDEQLEELIELIEGLVNEEGYITLRASESERHNTTAYEMLLLSDCAGNEYRITFGKE